jgi:excisionase family DNA binding protein
VSTMAQKDVAPTATDTWLSLHEASAHLGVSPSTLRRWADAGRIPSRRTAGGHRRFDPAAVQALARQSAAPPSPALAPLAAPGPEAQPWHAHLTHGPGATHMRELGQRLLGLLIQYLTWHGDDRRFLADGRAVGADYGAAARSVGVPMSETVQAFLYFRGTFWRMALQIPPVTQATDVPEMARIGERIEHFMDAVLLSTIIGYEQAPPPGAVGDPTPAGVP